MFRSIVLAAATVALAFCSPECAVEQQRSTASPDGRLAATVFVQDCHATAPFVTLVSLRCATCALDQNDFVFSIKGQPPVDVRWLDSRRLLVMHSGTEVYCAEPRWKDVSIEYQTVVPPRR